MAGVDWEAIGVNPHVKAGIITELWSSWYTAQNGHREMVRETEEFEFATDTSKTVLVKNKYEHKTHRPVISEIKEALKANIKKGVLSGDQWLSFDSVDEESEDKQEKALQYIAAKHRQNGFEDVVEQLLDDACGAPGNCYAGVRWVHETHTNPITDETQDGYVGPQIYRIDPDAIMYDITAASWDDTVKITRSVHSLADLKRKIEENPEMGYLTDVFKEAMQIRQRMASMSVEETNKFNQIMVDGFGTFTQYMKSGFVELIEFRGDYYDVDADKLHKNAIITVIDRLQILRETEEKTLTGRPMLFKWGYRRRRNNLVCMSPLANIIGMQYHIDHLENSRADAFDQMLFGEVIKIGDVQEGRGKNGKKEYIVTDGQGDVRRLAPDATVLNADFQIQEKTQAMKNAVGLRDPFFGVKAKGEQTMFEFNELKTSGELPLVEKMIAFERFLQDLVNAELELATRNVEATEKIKTFDEELGAEVFLTISRADLVSNGKLVPMGTRKFLRQSKIIQTLVQLQQGLLQDPEVVLHFSSVEMAKEIADLLNFEEFYQPYIRVAERLEAQRAAAAAQDILDEESVANDPATGEQDPTATGVDQGSI